MSTGTGMRARGFTLIELLTTLLIFSALAVMSYRALGAIVDSREHVARETAKWQRVYAFVSRFERDIGLASPRPVRSATGTAPAWQADSAGGQSRLEFSQFASLDGVERPRRVAYRFGEDRRIELWLWPALDVAGGRLPERYTVLEGVSTFELQYLDPLLSWVNAWPLQAQDPPVPKAVRLRIVLESGEEIVRIIGLGT